MRMNRRVATAAVTLGLVASSAIGMVQADAADTGAAAVGGCVGTGFSGTLGPGKAICNGNYLVRMQTNGDLVLRVIKTGHVCWLSQTARAPGGDTSATFHQNPIGIPYVDIDSTSQGHLGRLKGAHGMLELGSTASVNKYGEFYVGFKKIAGC